MRSPAHPLDLTGRVALITGAARGIGRVTARRLAELGATVVLADVLPEVEAAAEALRADGHSAQAACFDVADPEAVRAGVAGLRDTAGEIDVLVSNAAIVANIAPVARMTHASWERELAINLTGAFNMVQAVIGPMVERRWGRIIVISSGAAQGGLHNQAAYAASKAGLLGLVKTVTLEHARHGISCNAVLPGMIETENVRAMPGEIREAAAGQTPARRLGRMEEVAHLVAFLASEEAGFLNGAEINIDGGLRLGGLALGSRRELAQRGKT
ncbi:MAG: SDR family oxidoreductase [Thermoflexaceae bacterium]|nr:SDR family oxidoreductase [Thermoflexaceae bacterium]